MGVASCYFKLDEGKWSGQERRLCWKRGHDWGKNPLSLTRYAAASPCPIGRSGDSGGILWPYQVVEPAFCPLDGPPLLDEIKKGCLRSSPKSEDALELNLTVFAV